MTKQQFNWIQDIAFRLSFYGIDFGVNYWIACQFALESAFGTSKLAKECNNFCGMKSPKKRITLDVYPQSTFAEFDSLDKCIQDYVIWLAWNHFTMSEVQNVELFEKHLLNSGYCPEKDYIDKINFIYNQFKSYKNV